MSRQFKHGRFSPPRDHFKDECLYDKGLKRARRIRRLVLALLVANVVFTPKALVLHGAVIGAALLVGFVLVSGFITERRRAIKDDYL